MIEEFIDRFQTILYDEYMLNSDMYQQHELKDLLIEEYPDDFPMTCYEFTSDSQFEQSSDESKFLNDELYEDNWVFIENVGLIRFSECDDCLEISVFEINVNYRNSGFGRKIVECVEKVADGYYNKISVIPFDSEANDFWEHMSYINYKGFVEYAKEI